MNKFIEENKATWPPEDQEVLLLIDEPYMERPDKVLPGQSPYGVRRLWVIASLTRMSEHFDYYFKLQCEPGRINLDDGVVLGWQPLPEIPK